jgi:ABC-type phosphate transport system substrate-binding protein
MKKLGLIVMFAAGVGIGGPVAAADIQVIANPSVKSASVSVDELKNVFLGNTTSLSDGSKVEPVLAESGAAHDEFLKDVVGKSGPALKNHLKTLVFTGKGSMPKSFASEADIVKYVAKTPGAIGYVSAAADASGVKKVSLK